MGVLKVSPIKISTTAEDVNTSVDAELSKRSRCHVKIVDLSSFPHSETPPVHLWTIVPDQGPGGPSVWGEHTLDESPVHRTHSLPTMLILRKLQHGHVEKEWAFHRRNLARNLKPSCCQELEWLSVSQALAKRKWKKMRTVWSGWFGEH